MKPKGLSTGKMAEYLGISKDFLTDNKGILFFEGIHYTIPRGMKHPRWKVEAMEKWFNNMEDNISETAKQVLENILP